MTRRRRVGLLVFGMAVAGAGAIWVRSPGYMDADYYFASAKLIASGAGLHVPFVWNYLSSGFNSLPQPSHLYWMPLTSFLSAASMTVFGPSFLAAQLPFLALTACIPVLSSLMAERLGGTPRMALEAGLLAGFSGFYLPFLITTDAFSIYAVAGAGALWLAARTPGRSVGPWLAVGLLAGLAHLARADGLLLILLGVLAWATADGRRVAGLAALLGGYLAVMGPWFARMLALTGGPLSPGGLRAAWLLSYDQLFTFPGSVLTFQHWLAGGLGAITAGWWAALSSNLASLLLVNGLVFLGPLMFIGGWRLRHTRVVRLSSAYLLLLFGVMTLVFPWPGARGGFFHSSAALMPIMWALAPFGLESVLEWLQGRRGWDPASGSSALGTGMVAVAAVATCFLAWQRLAAPARVGQGWGSAERGYAIVSRQILPNAPGVVAVNNPPGFWLASGRPAVVIPDGGPDTLEVVARTYGVRWIVLEYNHPAGLETLYRDPEAVSSLRIKGQSKDALGHPIYVFEVIDPGAGP